LGQHQRIINFDAEISDGAFQSGMAEQELHHPQIACSLVDQRRLDPRKGVRSLVWRNTGSIMDPDIVSISDKTAPD